MVCPGTSTQRHDAGWPFSGARNREGGRRSFSAVHKSLDKDGDVARNTPVSPQFGPQYEVSADFSGLGRADRLKSEYQRKRVRASCIQHTQPKHSGDRSTPRCIAGCAAPRRIGKSRRTVGTPTVTWNSGSSPNSPIPCQLCSDDRAWAGRPSLVRSPFSTIALGPSGNPLWTDAVRGRGTRVSGEVPSLLVLASTNHAR